MSLVYTGLVCSEEGNVLPLPISQAKELTMADSNVTESKTTDNAVANDEATTPAAAVPSPAAMKAHAPSPAVLAKSPVAHLASSSSHDDVELRRRRASAVWMATAPYT